MKPARHEDYKELLSAVDNDDFVLAAFLWRQKLQHRDYCRSGCPYGVTVNTEHCVACLEGSLRTKSLYLVHDDPKENMYRLAANAIAKWLEAWETLADPIRENS